MAIAYDSNTGNTGTGTSSNASLTYANCALIICSVSYAGTTSPSSVTLNVTGMTSFSKVSHSGSNLTVESYYLYKSTGATETLTVTFGSNTRHAWSAVSWTGTDYGTDFYEGLTSANGSAASPTAASVSLAAGTSGRMAVSCSGFRSQTNGTGSIAIAPANSETERRESELAGGTSTKAFGNQVQEYSSSTARDMQATGTFSGKTLDWVIVAFGIKPLPDRSVDKTDTGTITEDKTVSVAAQTSPSVNKTELVAVLENATISIESVVADLNITTPTEIVAAVEVQSVSVAAQPTLSIDKTEVLAVLEVPTVGAITAVTLAPNKAETVLVNEGRTVEVAAQPVLEANKTETAAVAEEATAAIGEPVVTDLSVSGAVEAVAVAEARSVSVAEQPTLSLDRTEAVTVTEARTIDTAQPTLTPSQVETLAVVEVRSVAVDVPQTLTSSQVDSVQAADVLADMVIGAIQPITVSIVDSCVIVEEASVDSLIPVDLQPLVADLVAISEVAQLNISGDVVGFWDPSPRMHYHRNL